MAFPSGFNCGGATPSFRVGSPVVVVSGVASVSGLPAGVLFPGIYGADSISGSPNAGTEGFVSGMCNGLQWKGINPQAAARNTYGWNPDNAICSLTVGVPSTFVMTGYYLTGASPPYTKNPVTLTFGLYNAIFYACPPQASAMPPGLTLNSDGSITGTPTAVGVTDIAVVAWGADYGNASSGLQIQVTGAVPPVMTADCNNPPAGIVGRPYTHTFLASNGTQPYTWFATGALPTGLALTTGGVLSGIPTAAGTYSVGLSVSDALGASAFLTCSVTIAATVGTTPMPIAVQQLPPVIPLPDPRICR